MSDYRKLDVWRKAHKVTLSIYEVTQQFPKAELYGLTSQLRRAAASMGANIAEGCGRRGGGDMIRSLMIAIGSCDEVDYHLLLARDLELLSDEDYARLARGNAEVGRMLCGLRDTVQRRTTR